MYWQYGMSQAEKQAERRLSITLTQQLLSFLDPLLKQLDTCIDKRLIRTLLDTVIAIVLFRDRAKNLLLSELGAYIASPAHDPAGTKRLSNLTQVTEVGGSAHRAVFMAGSHGQGGGDGA